MLEGRESQRPQATLVETANEELKAQDALSRRQSLDTP